MRLQQHDSTRPLSKNQRVQRVGRVHVAHVCPRMLHTGSPRATSHTCAVRSYETDSSSLHEQMPCIHSKEHQHALQDRAYHGSCGLQQIAFTGALCVSTRAAALQAGETDASTNTA